MSDKTISEEDAQNYLSEDERSQIEKLGLQVAQRKIKERDSGVKWKPELPDTVYHYTDTKGLLGILNGSLWATSALYLNDPSEGAESWRFYASAYRRLYRLLHTPSPRLKPLQAEIDSDFLMWLIQGVQQPRFVVSFCTERDLLSQWRAYSKGYSGYSIGFSWKALRNFAAIELNQNRSLSTLFMPINYVEKAEKLSGALFEAGCLMEETSGVIEGYLKNKKTNSKTPKRKLAELFEVLKSDKARLSAETLGAFYFKDKFWVKEHEWRFQRINVPLEEIAVRPSATGPIPYYPVNIKNLIHDKSEPLIRSITVGPSVDYERSQMGVQEMLVIRGIKAKVLKSDAQYRIL